MSTFTQISYHIVFSTKNRKPVLLEEKRPELFKYIWGILKNKRCQLFRINGVEDHQHLLSSIHPTVALADLIRILKTSTSTWIKSKGYFPEFANWQEGYGAFTCSHKDRESIVQYIINQKEHHRRITFKEEIIQLLKNAGIVYDGKYLQ